MFNGLTVGFRSEGFVLAPDADAERFVEVDVNVVEMLGSETLAYFVAPVESAYDVDVRNRARACDDEESILAGAGAMVMCARLVPAVTLPDGAHPRLTINTNNLYFFDTNGDNLRHDVQHTTMTPTPVTA